MKTTVQKIAAFLLACVPLVFSGCIGYPEIGGIDDYDNFLNNLKSYSQPYSVTPPTIDGFTPLINLGFDYGSEFFGDFAFAVFDDTYLLMDKNRNLYYAPEDLRGLRRLYDKYIFKGGGYGVKSLGGNVLVEPDYDEIDINGGVIIASVTGGDSDIYYNGRILHKGVSGIIKAYSGEYVLWDKRLYYLDLTPVTAGGYSVLSDFINGARIISDGQNAGFEFENGFIIPPVYEEAFDFNEFGFALAADDVNGNIIIDKSGKIIYREDYGFKPVAFDGQSVFYMNEFDFTVVTDAETGRLCGPFEDLYDYKDYSGYLIETPYYGDSRFFSREQSAYFLEGFKSILPVNGCFIAETKSGEFILFDDALEVVFNGCDYIGLDGDILIIDFEGKYYYYERNITTGGAL